MKQIGSQIQLRLNLEFLPQNNFQLNIEILFYFYLLQKLILLFQELIQWFYWKNIHFELKD